MCVLVCVLLVVALTGQGALGQCDANTPYRTFDGSCNNLQNPSWGSANTPYGRLLPAEYGDGLSTPRRSKTGVDLPPARLLSLSMFTEPNVLDPRMSLVNMQFGQLVAHDMGLRAGSSDAVSCCQNGRVVSSPGRRCFPIPVLPNDPVLSPAGIQCLDLVRTLNTCDVNPANCVNRQAQQLNAATSFLDLSVVYGNSATQNSQLRAFVGGRMKVDNRNGTDWPPRHPQAASACTLKSSADSCYLTGDERSNITPELTILHIAFLREHNRIARQLQLSHSLWNDEKIFQEARRINIAQYQHIVYNEWLPFFLNPDLMSQRGLLLRTRDYVNDYTSTINPTVLNAHANGAFRYFHSSIMGSLSLHQESRAYNGAININDHMFNPTILERNDGYALLTRGMTTQAMGRNDWNYDAEIKHFLFRSNSFFGTDLKALDIQRSRDHGIAGYNAFRQYCGLGRATRWEDFVELRGPRDIQMLNNLYRTVDDVDLTVSEFFERHIPGTQAGPTYHCILMEQFLRTRRGDRFFFENGNTPGAFTPPQLNEIRKASMARILCDNTPGVVQMQRRAFQQIANDVNPLVPCNMLPPLEARLW
ncbi:peroxidase-like [Anopheles nili]|uniref:peroxidase-like n=1 Tax=Anopheles nili TaxID=185578 RepID=UPI00237A1DB4|nr:peroxidase-like [Anopheles nili]XP_053671838.1 peroxidase-like [Anopheles nili]XP_053671839.1 peroxidase-like [Anopheles nili]